jgi:hypothetical protein
MFAGNNPVNYADPSGLSLQGHPLTGGSNFSRLPASTTFGGFVDAGRGAQILGHPAIAAASTPARRPTTVEQFNRKLSANSNLSTLTRTVDPLQSLVQQQRAVNDYRSDQAASAMRSINEAGLVENAQLQAIRDSDSMGIVYRNSRAAGQGELRSYYNAVGTGVGTMVGVRGLSDLFSPHDAVDAHRQSAWERGFDGVTGSLALAGTAAPIAGVFRAVKPSSIYSLLKIADNGIDLTTYVPVRGVQANRAAGNAARDAIAAREAPALIEQNIRVTGGLRRVDVLKQGDKIVSIESKVGRTKFSKAVKQELARDIKSIRDGKVDEVIWEFSRSASTGKGGL